MIEEMLWKRPQSHRWRRIEQDSAGNLFPTGKKNLSGSVRQNPARRPAGEVVGPGGLAGADLFQIASDKLVDGAVHVDIVLKERRVESNDGDFGRNTRQ